MSGVRGPASTPELEFAAFMTRVRDDEVRRNPTATPDGVLLKWSDAATTPDDVLRDIASLLERP